MEFCYVLGMLLSCSSEVYILTLNNNKSHRYTCVCVLVILTSPDPSYTKTLNY